MNVSKRSLYSIMALMFGLAANLWAAGNGLKGEYFNNTNLVGTPALVRTDAAINFDWGVNGPGSGIATDHFSARWSGQVEAPATGSYTFRAVADRGVRVRLNHAEVIDGWNSFQRTSAPQQLVAGKKYDLEVEYFESSGAATMKLFWTAPGQAQALIPQTQLFSTPITPGLAVPPVYVSSLVPTFSQNGWGPYERDRSNGEAAAGDGHTLAIGGVKFARGLGVHAVSELRYALAGKFQEFASEIGIDDEVESRGSAVFQVWLDGVKAYESAAQEGSRSARSVSLDVSGKNELKLIVLGANNGTSYDHADWADARLVPADKLPAAPAGLTAAPGAGQVILSWMMTAGATDYRIYRGTTANMEKSTPIATVADLGYTDKGRVNGRKYFYKVAAVNASGTGGKSVEANATPGGSPTPLPPAPSGLTAAPGDKQVILAWSAVSGASSYKVFRRTSSGGEAAAIASGLLKPSFMDSPLTNGTTYFYRVAAVNATGTGDKSNEANATPNGASTPLPPAPAGLTAIPEDKQVKLAWTAVPGAASYKVFRGTSAGGEAANPVASGVTSPSFTDANLTNGITYFYKVAAVNIVGTGGMSNEASAKPTGVAGLPAPTGFKATPGDKQVALSWASVAGATGYNVYRGLATGGQAANPIASNIPNPAFNDTPLTNGTTYFYKVAAVNLMGPGERSSEASAKPVAPPAPPAPTGLTATPGDKQVVLAWDSVSGATGYNVYRGTAAGGEAANAIASNLPTPSYTNTGLVNGTTYFYKVAAVNANGTSDKSNEASAKPVAPPPPAAPTGLTVLPGDKQNQLTWTTVTGATSYNVYRGTKAGAESTTPLMTGVAAGSFTDPGLVNGTMYFYKVAAVNANGTSDKSNEASGMPTAPGLLLTDAQKDAFRFLRQSTFGPNLTLVNHVVQVGKAAFLDEQFALPPTNYPDALITMPNMELVSEQMMQNAIQGQDQLRQRVAWALSQIFVVSANKVDNTHAMVPYIRMLEQNAFGNVKDIMHDVSLSPAMGEFLDMVNNKKATGNTLPNENYAREWLQLLSIGLQELNDNGTPMLTNGVPTPTYTQSSIADLARVLTGWTYGDAKSTNPTRLNPPYYDGPMKPVDNFHDMGQKVVLGQTFQAGQTTQQDFDQALALIFNHHNVGPFLVRELIQRLVTSNPSPTYIGDVVAVFNNNGQGVRGDLKAVVKAILLHPEAANGAPTSGKLSEPVLFLTTFSRALGAAVVDHPFLTDFSQSMAQQVWFAPSVFNYFSPNYRAGGLFAPEMQIWTTATAMTRTNFIASLISGGFGSDVTINYAPYTAVAADPNALVDTVNALIMGGTMSTPMRQAIVTAVQASSGATERIRTALYLAASSMQYQVEH